MREFRRRSSDEMQIKAYVPTVSEPRLTYFPRSRVAEIYETGTDTSKIKLDNGTEVPVALSVDDLYRRIWISGDGDCVDLTAETGGDVKTSAPVEKKQSVPAVAFETAAEPKPVTIRALVRKHYGGTKVVFDFTDKDIDWKKIRSVQTDNSICGQCVIIPLPGVKTPLDEHMVLIDVSLGDFLMAYEKAKASPEKRMVIGDIASQPAKFTVFAKQQYKQNFKLFTFSEDDIDWQKVEPGNGQNGENTTILLKKKVRDPFGQRELILDMPHADFMTAYKKAKAEGEVVIDLRAQTSARGPTGIDLTQ